MALGTSDQFFLNAVQHFDAERHLFQKNIELISPNESEIHLLDWDSRQRREDMEVSKIELEKAKINIELNEAKIKRAKEILEEGQLAKTSRKTQIELLSELSQPVEHDITYCFNDSYPASRETSAASKSKFNNPEEVKKMVSRRYRTGEIVKLESQLTDMNQQIAKNCGALLLRIAELKSEISKKEENNFEDVKQDYAQAAEMIEELEKVDFQCFRTVRETLQLRLRLMISQREEIEENENLAKDKNYFDKKEAEARRQLVEDTTTGKKRLDKELANTTKEYQRQLDELDHQAEQLKRAQKSVQDKMESGAVEHLHQRYDIVKGRYIKLKKRHALEMEGFNAEADILKNKIKKLQKQIAIADRNSI